MYQDTEQEEDIEEIKRNLDDILDTQIIISQLSNMTYRDTEEMDTYEREYIARKLIKLKQDEIDARLKAMQER